MESVALAIPAGIPVSALNVMMPYLQNDVGRLRDCNLTGASCRAVESQLLTN